jgi:DNA-binding transcriptional LysR family regulator
MPHCVQDAISGEVSGAEGQLKTLQDVVGERLYTRTAYGVTLTDAGHDLLRYARVVMLQR